MNVETSQWHQTITLAAERLAQAQANGRACAPVSDLLGQDDVALAYRVQKHNIDRQIAEGAKLVGRKIGLTSAKVQAQIGVDRPDFGALLDTMAYQDGDEVPCGRLLQPKAEAEIAFRLKHDILDASDPASVRAAVDLAYPALEIVDSRIADWRIGITDTVADNASSGMFVIGAKGLSLADFEPRDAVMEMRRNADLRIARPRQRLSRRPSQCACLACAGGHRYGPATARGRDHFIRCTRANGGNRSWR